MYLHISLFCFFLQAIKSTFHKEFFNRICCSCYPGLKMRPTELSMSGVRYAYQPKAKLKRKATEVPGYRIGVTKGWDSWHTGMSLSVYRES